MPSCSRADRTPPSRTRCIWRWWRRDLTTKTKTTRRRPSEINERTEWVLNAVSWPAECGQVDALQCTDGNGGGAGGELSLLHDRTECRRSGGARPAAGAAGPAGEVGA